MSRVLIIGAGGVATVAAHFQKSDFIEVSILKGSGPKP